MDETLKKSKKLVKFMRDQGVLSLKTQGIELCLSEQALFPKKARPTPAEELKDDRDPMETLLWSAPGLELDEEHG